MAEYLPNIVEGFFLTIRLALAIVVTGIVAGLVFALIRSFRIRVINFFIVIIVMFYFALPSIGIRMSGFTATWLSLSLVLTAFAEEIFWAGILSVPKGQWEAARSTGLTFMKTMRYVVLPQAVRLTIPPLTNRTMAVTKGTALGAVVAVGEILNQAQTGLSLSYNPSPLTLGAFAYLLIFGPVVYFGRWIETRFAWKR
jgi:polar amino acid transport system permease protein